MTQKLFAEITTDPLGRGYTGMTDQQIADSLNAVDRTRLNVLSSAELLAWSGAGADDASGVASRYERIETAASSHASGAVRGACKAAIRLIDRDATELDLSLPDRATMVAALVAGGVLTAAEQTELVAMATENISRATEIGIGVVYAADVTGANTNA